MRKPFFKKSHKCWYVRVAGSDVRLDPDEAAAHKLWQHMVDTARPHDGASFSAVASAWMEEHKSLVKPVKYKQAVGYILQFAAKYGDMPCLEITRGKVQSWLDEPKPGQRRKDGTRGTAKQWAQATKKDAAGVIKRIYLWACQEGKLSRNPLAGVRVEDGDPRLVLINPDDHARVVQELMKCVDNRQFALYLRALKCGCRPIHIREVRTENVTEDCTAWVFQKHKTKGKTKRPLIVHLHPCVSTLTKIAMHFPQGRGENSGLLFVNDDGNQWTSNTIGRRIRRMRKRMNLPASFIAYAYRHTFATDAMLAGVNMATVAALLGHKDTRVTSRVYGHLDQHTAHLKEAAAQAASMRFRT